MGGSVGFGELWFVVQVLEIFLISFASSINVIHHLFPIVIGIWLSLVPGWRLKNILPSAIH